MPVGRPADVYPTPDFDSKLSTPLADRDLPNLEASKTYLMFQIEPFQVLNFKEAESRETFKLLVSLLHYRDNGLIIIVK